MKNDLNIKFGTHVRQARESAKLSREKLSEMVGFSTRFLAHVENGESGVKLENIPKLCLALGVSADFLLFGRECAELPEISNRVALLDDEHREYIFEIVKAYTDLYLKHTVN